VLFRSRIPLWLLPFGSSHGETLRFAQSLP
jgi:hypothetical protein